MPRRNSRRAAPAAPAVVAQEGRLKKIAKNGYVQFAATTLVVSGVSLATGQADITAFQAVGTTALVGGLLGATVAVAKTAKAAYDNATMENIKAAPGAAIAKVKSGASWLYSFVPAIRNRGAAAAPVAPAVQAEDAPAPARRRSRRVK